MRIVLVIQSTMDETRSRPMTAESQTRLVRSSALDPVRLAVCTSKFTSRQC